MEARARSTFTNLTLHSIAHFFIDLYSAALSAFQPFLVQAFGMSLTQAGLLGGLLVFSSSTTQPAYGYLSDRYRSRLFTALAPAVAGIFISCLGLVSSFWMMAVMVILGGAGVASFHPQGSARATLGIDQNRGRWMAVFISSGTLGLSLGPAFFTLILSRYGLAHTWWGAVPGILVTIVLLAYLPDVEEPAEKKDTKFDWAPLMAVWRPLLILYFLVFIRSVLQITYTQFLPLYLSRERGYAVESAGWMLTAYLACGALGGFVGGNLADRFGGRAVILASMILSVPALALFFWGSGWVAAIGLALGGLTLLFTIPVNVVMAQQLVPEQAGTVSALMMGFAWGVAGMIFIPLVGWAGDRWSLHLALSALLLFPLIGAVLTQQLKRFGWQ